MSAEDFCYQPSYSSKIGEIIDTYISFISNSAIDQNVCETAEMFYGALRANLDSLCMNYRKFFNRHEANSALLEKDVREIQ